MPDEAGFVVEGSKPETLPTRVRILAMMWWSLARSREKEEEKEERSLGLRLERSTQEFQRR